MRRHRSGWMGGALAVGLGLVVAPVQSGIKGATTLQAANPTVVGKWTIGGLPRDYKASITFGRDGVTSIETGDNNSVRGIRYRFAHGKIEFSGSVQVNSFSVRGTWTLAWRSADELTTVDDQGRTLTLRRVLTAPGE